MDALRRDLRELEREDAACKAAMEREAVAAEQANNARFRREAELTIRSALDEAIESARELQRIIDRFRSLTPAFDACDARIRRALAAHRKSGYRGLDDLDLIPRIAPDGSIENALEGKDDFAAVVELRAKAVLEKSSALLFPAGLEVVDTHARQE